MPYIYTTYTCTVCNILYSVSDIIMKKIVILSGVMCISLIWATHAACDGNMPMTQETQICMENEFRVERENDITPAVVRLHSNWLTKYSTYTGFQPETLITREQAAKFYSEFARTILHKQINTNTSCTFKDIAEADTTLVSSITTACQLGIFKWSKWSFFPKRTITRAESYAVLGRMLDATLTDKFCSNSSDSSCTRYSPYETFLTQYGLWMRKSVAHMRDQDPFPGLDADRGGSAYMLYMTSKKIEDKSIIVK